MQIVETLGFSEVVTYLVQAPPYVIAYFATLAISWSSGRFGEHCFHIIVPILVALAGSVLMISTLNMGARYFSLILLCTGPFVGLNVRFPITEYQTAANHNPDTNFLGNHSRSTAPDKESCVGCHSQLCLFRLALVYAVLLP